MTAKVLTTGKDMTLLAQACVEIDKIVKGCEAFFAIYDNDPKYSFNKSMKAIMDSSDEPLILFEDDVMIKESSHFEKAISQLPEDWDLCYLGANLVAPIERYSDNLFKTFGAWTTHAVMYREPKKIGERYKDTTIMFDDWLKTNIHPNGKSFIISPMIAWQRPHKSDLWNQYTDYTRIFDDNAEKLK